MVWSTPIYDRTAADVAEAKRLRTKIISSGYDSLTAAEKAAYEAGLKGAENYTDFNRQKNNIAYIAGSVAADLGYYPEQTTMDDILASDIESAEGKEIAWLESINTIESNLANIANSGASLPSGWQDSKTWVFGGSNPDYSDFNRWESNAKLIYEMAERMKIRFRPAGTFASGQANILPRRAV